MHPLRSVWTGFVAIICACGASCGSDGSDEGKPPGDRSFTASWIRAFPHAGSGHLRDVGVDDTGASITAGHFSGVTDLGDGEMITAVGSYENPYVVKVDGGGQFVWKKHVTFNTAVAEAFAAGPEGTVALAGFLRGSGDFFGTPVSTAGGLFSFLVVFAADGRVKFVRILGGEFGTLRVGGVAVGTDGRVVIYGKVEGYLGVGDVTYQGDNQGDAALFVFGGDGAVRFGKIWPAAGAQTIDRLAFDAEHRMVFLASASGADFGGGRMAGTSLVTLSSEGAHVDSRALGYARGAGLAVGRDGTVAIAGAPSKNGVSVFGPNHELKYMQSLTGTNGQATVTSVALGPAGTCAIVGEGMNDLEIGGVEIAAGGSYAFGIELGSSGTPLRSFVGRSASTAAGEAVAYDKDGGLIVKGFFTEKLTLPGLGPLVSELWGGGDFLLRVD